MPSTGGGAGRRTDRLSDGIKPLQLRERPPAAVPLLPLYRKTRAGVDYFIRGGAGPTCMKDLVVRRLGCIVIASRGQDLQVEHPVRCRYVSAFDFHPTQPRVLGSPLIGNQVVQMRQASQKHRLTPARMMESLHREQLAV